MQRISGQSVDFRMDGDLIHAEKVTLDITDNTATAQTRGVPDGWVSGDVAAEGEIELTSKAFQQLTTKARAAGSWRGLPTVDLMWYAKAGNEELKVEAFACKLVPSNVLDNDPKGGSTLTHKVKYLVTGTDFVHINGVPYLSADDTRDLIG
ncbi:DUF2597 family protein [Jejubacter calystegiae]|uniref:DUF2597 family protein n=1 Tax=Jejubacter calystegiae TaxID=2579935 RepID=A0A4P8YFF7_9ENTR|nr:phage protein [Jejubacter calystegiae]QCT18486.1 DUF2597 family protein [Jejubacter calystegiae]